MQRKTRLVAKAVSVVALLGATMVSIAEEAASKVAPDANGWPNFMGPNRNSAINSSTKLLEKWPEQGPKLLWVSGDLPEAPLCGTSSPVVCDGKVYVYAHVLVPLKGIFPFRHLLEVAGYPGDMPADLLKAVDEIRLGAERKAAPNKMEDIKALVDKFMASLEPAIAKKYETVIRGRIGKGDRLPTETEYKWILDKKDLEVATRQEYLKVLHTRFGGEGGGSKLLAGVFTEDGEFAEQYYKDQVHLDDVFCLEAATGKQLWKQSCPGNFESYGHDYKCSGTPAVANGKVFLRGSGGLHCLDAHSGKMLWHVKGPASCSSAVVVGEFVYCYMPVLTAFDAKTGSEVWQEPKVRHTFQTPALWVHGGKTYLLGVDGGITTSRGRRGEWLRNAHRIFCLDASTGKIMWDAEGTGNNTKASPVISGDVLTLRGGRLVAYALAPEKATELWSQPNFTDNCGTSAIIYNGHVYSLGRCYGDEFLKVLDLKDGNLVLKQFKRDPSRNGGEVSTPLIASGIAFTSDGGARSRALVAFKAAPDKYEEVGAVNEAPKKGSRFCSLSTVALSEGRLYARLSDAVACYDVSEAGNR